MSASQEYHAADPVRAAEEFHAAENLRVAEAARAAEEERAVEQALALVGRRTPTSHPTPSRPDPTGPNTSFDPAISSHPTASSDPSDPTISSVPSGPTASSDPTAASGASVSDVGGPSLASSPASRSGARVPSAHGAPPSPHNPSPHSRSPHNPSPHSTSPHSPSPRQHRVTSWPDARALAERLGTSTPRAAHRLSLDRALGHVLAEAVVALTDLPSFDTSAMDGWVVAGPGPWTVHAGQGLLAGQGTAAPLPDGAAVRIATGARIPSEATAVIRSEHAHADESKGLLHTDRDVVPGQDIRPRGQECRSGDQLLPVGTLVTPPVIGLAAAAGYDALIATPRPRVDVLVLGDELLTAGLPREGLIRDALGPMLVPWLRALGAEVTPPRHLGDDAEGLRRTLATSEADLIVTTGGTAAGPVDHVHPVLAGTGATLLVDGVAVRPGHPMLLARLADEGPYLVGLPGNPLAAVSGLLTLAEPLIRGIAGRSAQEPFRAPMREEVHGHPQDTRLVPVIYRGDSVLPLHYNGPAMLRGVAAADGLAVVPPGGVRSGTEVEILDLPWASATPWTEGCFT
ncbi:molybdopterin-binding protein [Streptomyces sp. NPDC005899]|uniref:molybdopterin molybdotransferase MoeA n=1 Tax=Streptomyces sp. NPDC005899 TaxID=3155716 RepID=UPI0033FCAF63